MFRYFGETASISNPYPTLLILLWELQVVVFSFEAFFSVRDKPTKLWYQNNPYALKGKHVGTESVFGGKTDPFLLISTTVKERNRGSFVFLTFPIDMITNK